MNILLANVIVYLTRYAVFIKQFFKNKYFYTITEMVKWSVFAYSFYLVKGYSAVICYMLLIVYEALKLFRMNKYILFNTALFLVGLLFVYLSKKYRLIYLLPYFALFVQIILKPLLKNKNNKYTNILIDILICIYSYNYKLYVLFLFKVLDICFPLVGSSLKNITDFTNKRTN